VSGYLDLQVNGYAGIDFNDAALTAGALDHALAAMRAGGVSHCLPTLITAPAPILAERLAALDRAVVHSRLGPAMVPGFHLEGPFLNPAPGFAGCHPAAAMIPPDAGLLDRLRAGLARPVLLLTLAPELPGAVALIRAAVARGIAVALGHTAATMAQVAEAAEAGATLSTHLGNALPSPVAKFENPLMAQLAEDRLSASVIADGIHLPPHALRVIARAKGDDRMILVTDATAAADVPAGRYGFAGMDIARDERGAVRLPCTDRLAGSALTMADAVRNVVAWGIATEAEAPRWARDNPRALLAPALAAHGLSPW
jgi:N-acetylglucosamine-6-phosphate deacetylase